MRSKLVFSIAAAAFIGLAASLLAQQPDQQRGERGRGGPPGGGMFGGGGGFLRSRMSFLLNADVKKELELADEQVAEIEKVNDELRAKYPSPFGGRGPGGPGGPGGGDRGRRGSNNNEGAFVAPAQWYFVVAQEPNQQPSQGRGRPGGGGPGGGPPMPTPEQQAEFEKQRLERSREERAKLAEILLPHQIKRLNEIFIQQNGVSALQDEDIAKDLGVSEAQKAKLAEVRLANRQTVQDQMRALFQGGGGGGGDREANRAKIEEIQKAADAKLLAVLTPDQQKKFEEMKGKPFTMTEERRGFGGPGGNRTRGEKGGNNNN